MGVGSCGVWLVDNCIRKPFEVNGTVQHIIIMHYSNRLYDCYYYY